MSWDSRLAEFEDVEVRHRTDKALLVVIEGDEYWIPISQIRWEETTVEDAGNVGTLAMSQWIAEQKGLV